MDTITVTPGAIESISELQQEYGDDGWGLRYGISGGGCSGYKYVLEFEEDPEDDDLVFDQGSGLRVFVKREHMEKLKNSVIDWKDSLMESGFDISNPQAKRPCGCGESVDF
jgi:iron-sulfur cluster assembly accessory protein